MALAYLINIFCFLLIFRRRANSETLQLYVDSENTACASTACSGTSATEAVQDLVSALAIIENMDDSVERIVIINLISVFNIIEDEQLTSKYGASNDLLVFLKNKKQLSLTITSSDESVKKTISLRTFRVSLLVPKNLTIKSVVVTSRDIIWLRGISASAQPGNAATLISDCKARAKISMQECCQEQDYYNPTSFCYLYQKVYFSKDTERGLRSLFAVEKEKIGLSWLSLINIDVDHFVSGVFTDFDYSEFVNMPTKNYQLILQNVNIKYAAFPRGIFVCEKYYNMPASEESKNATISFSNVDFRSFNDYDFKPPKNYVNLDKYFYFMMIAEETTVVFVNVGIYDMLRFTYMQFGRGINLTMTSMTLNKIRFNGAGFFTFNSECIVKANTFSLSDSYSNGPIFYLKTNNALELVKSNLYKVSKNLYLGDPGMYGLIVLSDHLNVITINDMTTRSTFCCPYVSDDDCEFFTDKGLVGSLFFLFSGSTISITKMSSIYIIGCGWGSLLFLQESKGYIKGVNTYYTVGTELGGIFSLQSNSELTADSPFIYYTQIFAAGLAYIASSNFTLMNSNIQIIADVRGGVLGWISYGNMIVDNTQFSKIYAFSWESCCFSSISGDVQIEVKNSVISMVWSESLGGDLVRINSDGSTNITLINVRFRVEPHPKTVFLAVKGLIVYDSTGKGATVYLKDLVFDMAGYLYYYSLYPNAVEGTLFELYNTNIHVEGLSLITYNQFPKKDGMFFNLKLGCSLYLSNFSASNIQSFGQPVLFLNADKNCKITLLNILLTFLSTYSSLITLGVSNQFTLANSSFDNISSNSIGAVLSTLGDSNLVVLNTNFTNIRSSDGNAFNALLGDLHHFENATFANIFSGFIGGVFIIEKEVNQNFLNCLFLNLTSVFSGGFMVLTSSNSANFLNCIFSYNKALNSDSGVLKAVGGNNITFKKCRFYNNSASNYGGVFSLVSFNFLSVQDCIFWFEVNISAYLHMGNLIHSELFNDITLLKISLMGSIYTQDEGILIYLNSQNKLKIYEMKFLDEFGVHSYFDQKIFRSLIYSWSKNNLTLTDIIFKNLSKISTFFNFYYEGRLELNRVTFYECEVTENLVKSLGEGSIFTYVSGRINNIVSNTNLLFFFNTKNDIAFHHIDFRILSNENFIKATQSRLSLSRFQIVNQTLVKSSDISKLIDSPSLIFLDQGYYLCINDSSFIGIFSKFYMSAITTTNADVFLNRNTFLLNTNENGFGGAFSAICDIKKKVLSLKKNVFARNQALHGGAMFVLGIQKLAISKNIFKAQLAKPIVYEFNETKFKLFWNDNPGSQAALNVTKKKGMGGAFYLDHKAITTLTISKNKFVSNKADIGGLAFFENLENPDSAQNIFKSFMENFNIAADNHASYQGPLFSSNLWMISVQSSMPFRGEEEDDNLRFIINFSSRIEISDLALGIPATKPVYFIGVDCFKQFMFFYDNPRRQVELSKNLIDPNNIIQPMKIYASEIFPGVFRLDQIGDKLPSSTFFRSVKNWEVDIFTKELFDSKSDANPNVTLGISTRNCRIGEFLDSEDFSCKECDLFFYSFETSFGDQPTSCKRCDITTNFWCLGGPVLIPKPGFWRINSKSPYFFKCPHEAACISNTTLAVDLEDNSTFSRSLVSEQMMMGYCAKGYKSFFCAVCEDGYGMRSNYICDDCSSPSYWVQIILQIVLKTVLYFYTLHTSTKLISSKAHSQSKFNLKKNALMKIILNYCQIMTIFISLVEINKSFRDVFTTIFVPFSPEVGNTFNFDCVLKSYGISISIHYVKTFLLVSFSILLTISYLGLLTLLKRNRRAEKSESPELSPNINPQQRLWMNVLLVSIYFFYVDILQLSIQYFNCFDFQEYAESALPLIKDINIDCHSKSFLYVRYFVALPLTITLGLIYPIYLFWRIKSRGTKDLELGYFTALFSKRHPYYEMVFLLRKECIILLNVFIVDFLAVFEPIPRQYVIFLIFLFFSACWVVHQSALPFKKKIKEINGLEKLYLDCSALTFILLTADLAQRGQTYYEKYNFANLITVLIVNIYIVANWLWAFITNLKESGLIELISPIKTSKKKTL